MSLIETKIIQYYLECDAKFCNNSVYEESMTKTEAKATAKHCGFKLIDKKWYCDKCVRRKGL